jgi:hypothetical protein
MEAVTILRELWRRRILVAVVALVSILAGLATIYTVSLPPESRSFDVGIANGRILVDTPDSQVVDVQPKGSGTLGIRAGVVANLMTEGDVKAAIAKRAGLRPNQLRAGVVVDGAPPAAVTNAAGDPNAHLLTTSPAVNPDGTPLPMVDIQTQAPKPADAAKLVEASVSGLNDYLNSKAAGEDVPDARRLQVTGFGAPEVRKEAHGGQRLLAAAAAFVVFLLGCAAILIVSRLARAWRVAATLEDDQELEHEPEPETPEPTFERAVQPAEVVAQRPGEPDEVVAPRRWWRKAPAPAEEPKRLKRSPVSTSAPTAAFDREEPSRNGDSEAAEADSVPVRS